MEETKRVLIVSSRPPEHFGGLGDSIMKGLQQNGYEVDYLTLFQTKHPHVIGVFPENERQGYKSSYLKKKYPFLTPIGRWINKFRKIKSMPNHYIEGNSNVLVSPDEENPPVNIEIVLNKITHFYDFVYIHCWQDMLTSKTIEAIYQKLQVPFILSAYDFQPFSGGCYYFRGCLNWQKGCGCCPVLKSNDANDITHQNYLKKKQVYSSIQCSVRASQTNLDVIKKSKLFQPTQLYCPTHGVMDESLYKQQDIQASRKHLEIPNNKTFVIFSRYAGMQHNAMKGYDYLVESINIFASQLSLEEREHVLLLLAGTKDTKFESLFNVDVKNVGLLSIPDLIKAYSASTLFVSSSVDEAGPTMVSQSELCGTPVVAFNIGSALRIIENGITGWRTTLRDSEKLAECIMNVYRLDEREYIKMRERCREKTLEKDSLRAGAASIIDQYLQMKNTPKHESF